MSVLTELIPLPFKGDECSGRRVADLNLHGISKRCGRLDHDIEGPERLPASEVEGIGGKGLTVRYPDRFASSNVPIN